MELLLFVTCFAPLIGLVELVAGIDVVVVVRKLCCGFAVLSGDRRLDSFLRGYFLDCCFSIFFSDYSRRVFFVENSSTTQTEARVTTCVEGVAALSLAQSLR